MTSNITEINKYLQHEDYSLAVRRMLDISLDINDPVIIRKAIEVSRHYNVHSQEEQWNNQLPVFLTMARELVNEIAAQPSRPVSPEKLVDVEQVSKTYTAGSNFRLHPVSMRVSTGDIIGLVGENGNGKTTFLRCLAGQLSIDNGRIQYTTIPNIDYYAIKHSVAFIPQRIDRWYGRLKDNLHFSAAIAGVKGEQNELMVDFMLERLRLSGYANLTWDQISSGYRTRFEIARVLLQRPSLLILDEPLANLDINAQQTMLTDLKFLAKSVNHPMGVVLSSQQLHEVEKIADNVLFIKQGVCIYQDNQRREKPESFILEVETNADRSVLTNLFGEDKVNIQFNGGFYTLTSSVMSAQEILQQLVNNNITITYARDITYSTKRFF